MVSEKDAWEYVLRRVADSLAKAVREGDAETAAGAALVYEMTRSLMKDKGHDLDGVDREAAA